MKKTILSIAAALIALTASSQNGALYYENSQIDSLKNAFEFADTTQCRALADSIAKMAGKRVFEYEDTFISMNKDIYCVNYRDKKEGKGLSVYFKKYTKGANIPLEIPGIEYLCMSEISCNFLDRVPMRQKLFDPTSTQEELLDKNGAYIFYKGESQTTTTPRLE